MTARNDGWLSDAQHAEVKGVARIANEIIPRGWEFDRDKSSDQLLTWYYPESGVELGEQTLQPVTRIWLDDPAAPHVLLVGSPEGEGGTVLTVEQLFARLPEIEAYRLGGHAPDLVGAAT
jgi:hypothetical protein